jgi:hypothetical protein
MRRNPSSAGGRSKEQSMSQRKPPAIVFVGLGVVFLALGISTNRTFTIVGAAFLFVGAVMLVRRRSA